LTDPSSTTIYSLYVPPSLPNTTFTFFFYSSRPPRALHSFPTRRSSDLLRAADHRSHQIDQTRCASGKGTGVGKKTGSVFHDTFLPRKLEGRSFGQTSAGSRIGHKGDSAHAFRAIGQLHQRGRNVVFFRNQFAANFRLAQRKLEQTGDTFGSTSSRRRHAIESVRHAPHSVLQSGAGFFLPGIGMATANDNSGRRKFFDRCQSPFSFRCDCDALDHVAMFEQAPNQFGGGLTNKFGILRTSLIPRDEWPFDVCPRDLRNL